jgi:DNA-binding XRE family transcriptional regulator
MNVAEQFGDNLKRVRKEADLSQDELSVRASVHRTEISQLERGLRVARIDTLINWPRRSKPHRPSCWRGSAGSRETFGAAASVARRINRRVT